MQEQCRRITEARWFERTIVIKNLEETKHHELEALGGLEARLAAREEGRTAAATAPAVGRLVGENAR